MPEHTPQSTERQYAFRPEGVAPALTLGLALIGALIAISITLGRQPQQPQAEYYRPDPPMIDNSVKVEILSNNSFFSNNQTCIGQCR